MATKEFKLRRTLEGSATRIKLNAAQGGGSIILNRGSKKISVKGSPLDGLEVASQDDLQRVYDNSPEFAKMIQAPDGHKAPWEQDSPADSIKLAAADVKAGGK